MQKQGGGGNDPSCGCDMQAGWPPASEFPRGGIQGGGAINSFNLALTNNEGKVTHYRGKRNNGNLGATAMIPEPVVPNGNNLNTNLSMKNNNTNVSMNTNNTNLSMKNNNNTNNNVSMNNTNNTNNNVSMNNNNNTNNNVSMNNNNTNNNLSMNNNTNTNNNTETSSMEKIVFKGKRYYKQKNTGNAYTRNKNGKKGSFVGRFVENANGKMNLDSSLPASGGPPSQEVDIESEGVGPETARKTLSQNGGGSDPVCGSCPFPGTGACPFYARGGGCGCGMRQQSGGGCPCSAGLLRGGSQPRSGQRGGYRATRKNLKALKKWKQGKSIGFTMTASLKAKGLIPRTSRKMKGKKVVSRKYK